MTKQDHWRPQGNERTDSPPSDVVEQFQQEDLRWAISACRSFQNKIVRYQAQIKELEERITFQETAKEPLARIVELEGKLAGAVKLVDYWATMHADLLGEKK